MTEAPLYQVVLNYSKVKGINPIDFPKGFPCYDFQIFNDDENNDPNFAFVVDREKLSKKQKNIVAKNLITSLVLHETKGFVESLLIPLDWIESIVEPNGSVFSPKKFKETWLLVNRYLPKQEISFALNGKVIHLLIMGLQQSLRVDQTVREDLNSMILELTCKIIDQLCETNTDTKEYYLDGFPPKYQHTAIKLLGL